MSNTIYRPFLEKLGGTNVNEYVGDKGEVFYDPEVGDLRVSDGITPGGVLLTGGGGGGNHWVRPSDWLAMPTVLETEEKFVGLFAVFDAPENFIALYFEGDYTVDWGDGNVENYFSGDKAQHSYVWSDIPSSTLTTEGYRQVLVTVTPQVGQHLTVANIGVRHDYILGVDSSTPWLDLIMTLPQLQSGKSLILSDNGNSEYLGEVQSIQILNSGNCEDFSYLLYYAISLRNFSLGFNIVTNMNGMFSYCYALTTVPQFDTASVTDMSYMFSGCSALQTAALNGTKVNVVYSNCLLGRQSIVDIFNGLGTASATINISNNYGTASLTQEDKDIAINKGWTITT